MRGESCKHWGNTQKRYAIGGQYAIDESAQELPLHAYYVADTSERQWKVAFYAVPGKFLPVEFHARLAAARNDLTDKIAGDPSFP